MATKTTSKKPSHYLYAITERKDSDKGYWTRIGAAWPNADGKGWSFKLDMLPLNGADLVMREPKDDSAEGAAAPSESTAVPNEGGVA